MHSEAVKADSIHEISEVFFILQVLTGGDIHSGDKKAGAPFRGPLRGHHRDNFSFSRVERWTKGVLNAIGVFCPLATSFDIERPLTEGEEEWAVILKTEPGPRVTVIPATVV